MASAPLGTRDRLVQATRDAINEVGLPAATAREITGRAAANLAAIPYHFGTKEALVTEALVAEAHELLAPILELLSGEDGSPVERAGAAVMMLGELFERSRSQVPAYLAALSTAAHSPDVKADLGALMRELRSRLAAEVRRQLDAGLVSPWVEPDALAGLVLAVANGVLVASVVDPDGPDHRAVAGQLLGLLVTARPEG